MIPSIIIAIFSHWEELTTAFRDGCIYVWESIVNAFGSAVEWFKSNVIQPVTKFFSDLWSAISTGATDTWDSIVDALYFGGNLV